MLPHAGRRRAGFTLVELLVVLAIIAIVISLTLAGVQAVRSRALQTENAARLLQTSEAVGRLKNDLSISYLPPGAGFRLKPTYAATDPELKFLTRAFPNMDFADNGLVLPAGTSEVVLDGNQFLCFVLTGGTPNNYSGFSNNPRRPFSPPSPSGGESRKGPWLTVSPKLIAPGPGGQAWLVDAYGVPFAWFAPIDGQTGNYVGLSFSPTVPGIPPVGTATPVRSGGKYVNENGFQIISAGKDKVFGATAGTPTDLPATGTPGGADNQGHFSKAVLGSDLN